MLLQLTHRSFGAVLDTCTAFYAEAVVHDRISVPVLGYGVNGAQSDERTHMIVRAGVFIYVYHCVVFFANIMSLALIVKFEIMWRWCGILQGGILCLLSGTSKQQWFVDIS